jgi:hypothetical protein
LSSADATSCFSFSKSAAAAPGEFTNKPAAAESAMKPSDAPSDTLALPALLPPPPSPSPPPPSLAPNLRLGLRSVRRKLQGKDGRSVRWSEKKMRMIAETFVRQSGQDCVLPLHSSHTHTCPHGRSATVDTRSQQHTHCRLPSASRSATRSDDKVWICSWKVLQS